MAYRISQKYQKKLDRIAIATFQEVINWTNSNDGKMPRASIYKNGKCLHIEEMTEDEKAEQRLYKRWAAAQATNKYLKVPIEEVPEEYRDIIQTIKDLIANRSIWKEIERWLESHNGKMPSAAIHKNKKVAKIDEMTEEERKGVNLRQRWDGSKERKIFENYKECPEEQIPEEYRDIIQTIKNLMANKDILKEIEEWLKTHNGRIPREHITKGKKILKLSEMTEEERREVNLRKRWNKSNERKIFENYKECSKEQIPEEYRDIIQTIKNLMANRSIWKEIEEWLKTHNGRMPRKEIQKNKRKLKANEMTEEERYEVRLSKRWNKSHERKIFETYYECPEEQIPEEYRDIIKKLKLLGLGKTVHDNLLEWLETHNGRMPRREIRKNKRKLKANEMAEEERYEVRLRLNWNRSMEAYIFNKYRYQPIEDVPAEYREKIMRLRELIQFGKSKDDKIMSRMRQAVGKQINYSINTRSSLQEQDELNNEHESQ